MPNNNNRINFQVGYNVDQASVNAVKKSLQDLQNIKFKDFNGPKKDLDDIKQKASQVEAALSKAFNVNLNSLNTQAFNAELQKAGLSIDKIYSSFSKAGAQGQVAFSRMASEVLTTNMQLKLTNSLVSQMGETMANTVKWGIASSVMNNFTNSVRQAFDYVKALDSSLNDIRIVTKQSSDEMANFAVQANNSAQALGRSTMDYTKAALTFYQQGLDEASVQARTESVLKAQNITGAGLEMADYLTAVWNGYKVANEEAELYVDKLAAVADSSASNMSLLAIAMSKVASSANLLGVPVDNLNAQIATIVATTRQAPESVGNALKTIYSRINDIATGADDAEISLGNYSSKMAEVGINVLDANGRLRDTGDVIDEIGGKWETLSHEQQIYLARTMAGQRQYNNLLALFENWGKYSDLVNVSMEAQGATALKNAIYMESLSAKMEQLGAAGEKVKAALIDEDDLKGLVDFGTGTVNLFGNLILSIGGGKNAILALGSIFTQIFSGTIAKELNNTITNFQNIRKNALLVNESIQKIKVFGESQGYHENIVNLMVDAKKEASLYYKFMTAAQINEHDQLVKNIAAAKELLLIVKEKRDEAEKFAKSFAMSQTAKGQGLTGSNINEKILSEDFQLLSGTALLTVEALQEEINNFNFLKPKEGLESLTASFELLKNEVGLTPLKQLAGFDSYQNALDAIKDKANPTATEVRRVKIALENLLEQANGRISDAGILKQLSDQAKSALEKLSIAQKSSDVFLQSIKQFADIKSFVNMAAGLGQVASGINNIVNLTKVWKNENLSAGLKILQTFTNLSMTVTMLSNGITQIVKNFSTFSSSISTGMKTLAAVLYRTQLGLTVTDAALVKGTADAFTFAGALGTVATYALPIIAVAAAVGVAIYAMYKLWNRLADAAKKAALIAQETKKTYDDLKSSYDNLKSSLENYNSAQEAISEMTKGTQEWRDAIRESNDAVLDLIQSYPELASAVLNVNGQLILSEQGQQLALLNASTAVDNARLANIAATAESRDASLQSDVRNASRFAGLITYSGQFIQATTDQVMNLVEAYSTATDRSVLALAEQTGMSELLVSSILTEVDNMDLLIALLQANTEATKLSYEAMASERLQDNDIYKGLDDLGKQVAEAIAGRDLMSETDIDKFLMEDSSFKQLSKISNASDDYMQDILTRFRLAMGDASIDWASNAAQGFGGKLLHFMIDGQEALYTKEQVAATIAASLALKDLTGSVERARDVLNDIGNISDKNNSTALKDFIGNEGFGNLTRLQLDELNPYSHEMKVFFDLHAKELGYSGGKLFQNAFVEAQQAALKDWNSLGADSLKPVQNTINDFFKGKDFSLLTAKDISTALNNAFKQVGNLGLESLTSLFDDSTLNIDLIVKTISSADLSTPKGLNLLTEKILKIGDGSFAASEGWKDFVEQVNQTQFENPLDSIFERQENIEKITKGLSKYDIVNEEDYEILRQINPLIENMFTKVAGGYLFLESKGSLLLLLVGGTNGYFDAANQFDLLKNSALEVSKYFTDTFGEEFSSNAFQKVDLTKTVSEAFNQIDSQESSLQLWSALGFNEDYLQAEMDKYLLLLVKSNRTRLSESLQSEFSRIEQELQSFLNTASTAPDILQGVSDELRDAGALGLETISLLNDALMSGDLGEGLLAILRFNNALQKVSDTEMENLGFDVDLYLNFVKILQDTNEEMLNNLYLARQMAKANMRISKGMEDLIDNFDDWNDALLDFQENGDVSRLADSWGLIRLTMANLFDSDALAIDMLGPDFIANNMDKIQAVKDGVEGAYELLDALMDQQLILNAYGVSDFSQLDQDIQDAYQRIQDVSNDATILVGAVFSGKDALIQDFQDIADGAHWTSALAQAAFAAMGYNVEIEPENPDMIEDTESTQYYVPPTYRMVPKKFDFGPFGSGTMLLPLLDQGGHYESGGSGVKQTYKPGAYAIKTVTKNGNGFGGNISRGNAKSSAPRGGNGRGGGGGGGKAKAPSPATQAKVSTAKILTKPKTSTPNPYLQEEKSFDRQSKILDLLQNKLKKLVNKDRLKNLRQQNKVLAEQKDILQAELDISANAAAENSTADYARRLKQAFKDISFDKDGQIADINKIQAENASVYNAAAKAAADAFEKEKEDYNNFIENTWNKYATKDLQEAHKNEKELWDERIKNAENAAKEAIKDAELVYKEREDLIKSYNDAWKDDQDRLKEYNELTLQIYDNLILLSKIKVDLSIDVGLFERDWLDFRNKVIKKLDKDDYLGNAKANAKELMSYFDSLQVQKTKEQIESIRRLIDIMRKNGTSLTYGTNIAQAEEDLKHYMDQQMEDLLNIQELADDIMLNYLDALDDAKDKMDDQIDQYERINDLVEHNMKLTLMLYGDKAYDTMEKYYEYQKDNNQNILNNLRSEQLYWQTLLSQLTRGSDAWKQIKENLDNVTDDLNNKLEDMIDNLADQFENKVNGIIARVNNALTGGRGLDYLDEQWDYINNYDDLFLDTFESKTGIDEVERLYQSTIDGLAGSPKSQQALNKLMNDQLKLLRLKDHLTEYDLERAKASLLVEKARLALEEARDNKTKMRLRRDSQGNYTYQYVADELKLGDLQAALADAQANLYNTDKEHYKQNLNNLYDTYKDYILKMRDLTEEYNNTQDEEERKRIQARIDLLKEATNKMMNGLTLDNKYLLQYLNGSFFDGMNVDTSALTMEEQMLIMEQNIPQMQSNIQDLADTITGEGGILPATADMMKDLNLATKQYDSDVQQILNSAGTSLLTVTNVTDALGNSLDKNILQAQSLTGYYTDLINQSVGAITKIQDVLNTTLSALNTLITQDTIDNLAEAYNLAQKLNGVGTIVDDLYLDKNKKTLLKQNKNGVFASDQLIGWNLNTDTSGMSSKLYQDYLNKMSKQDSLAVSSKMLDTISNLDIGKLQLQDLKTVVNTIQAITDNINSIANQGIDSVMSNASGYIGNINNVEQLDQNVHIEANFPNVTQHTEIEQAFNNLVNMASMRASGYRD